MHPRIIAATMALAGAALAAQAPPAAAQHPGGSGASSTRPPREAGQWDFLVGEWSLAVKPRASGLAARIHGVPKLRGTWRAWRALDGWGIEDEMRIVDESGNPRSLVHAVRIWDSAARRWTVATVDAYRQRVATSAAQWTGSEMTSTGEGTDAEGKRFATRTRIDRIGPTSFRLRQDRSYDGGRKWEEGILVIEATRTAATASR